jgi:hypothetical protein
VSAPGEETVTVLIPALCVNETLSSTAASAVHAIVPLLIETVDASAAGANPSSAAAMTTGIARLKSVPSTGESSCFYASAREGAQ